MVSKVSIQLWYSFDVRGPTRGYIKNVAPVLYQKPRLIRLICFDVVRYTLIAISKTSLIRAVAPIRTTACRIKAVSKPYQIFDTFLISYQNPYQNCSKNYGKTWHFALRPVLIWIWYEFDILLIRHIKPYQRVFDIVWYGFDTHIKLYQSISKTYQNTLWYKCLIQLWYAFDRALI